MESPNTQVKLPKILRNYEFADFTTQLKARFMYYFYISVISCNLIVILTSTYIQKISAVNDIANYSIIVPEIILLLIFISCFSLLIKSYFELSAHLILVSTFACLWLVMFMDNNNILIKFDTVVYILGLLSSIQFFISKYRKTILIYTSVNIVMLIIFSLYEKQQLQLSSNIIIDFILDTGISMLFIGVIGYILHTINKRTLEKALSEIEERKKIEVALKESRDQYISLVSNIPGITFRCLNDSKWTMLYINNEVERISGYPASNFTNNSIRTFESIIVPEDNERIIEITNEAILHNKAWEIEYRIIHANGSVKWVYEKGRAIKNESANTLFLDGVIIDITEKKKYELELELHKIHLEQMVHERTEELDTSLEELHSTNEELYSQKEELIEIIEKLNETQNQLVQSEKMASLGVLSAGIAHEINNPLNFINGGIMGIEDYLNEHCAEKKNDIDPLINAINIGVQRASEIVSSLSHYSRQDNLPSEDCDIHQIIDHCLVMLNNQTKNKVEIKKQYTTEFHNVTGNEGKLHQVFLNIISNSEQAIEEKGTIDIFTLVKDNYFEIKIKDTGKGISQENIQKIFDPFFTTKAPGKGTGLGLSITYKIIAEHNGTINFNSDIDKGTTVTITFPLKPIDK